MMFYANTVQDTRQLFFSSWQKYRQKQALLPLEKQIAEVVLIHPEYHAMLEETAPQHEQAYFPELGQENPFLHMGFHLAIRDQVATDRPTGIAVIYQQLLNRYADISVVEHLLMEPLAECLWQAQRSQSMPDDVTYLSAARELLLKTKK